MLVYKSRSSKDRQDEVLVTTGTHAICPEKLLKKIMKKENKVMLKVLVEKAQKKFISKTAKENHISEAEVVRVILATYINNLKK